MSRDDAPVDDPVVVTHLTRPGVRQGLFALGCVCVGLGVVGVVIPGLPTTIFLIIALWAFARSSERLHRWLYTHPRFGASLQAWDRDRVVPVKAKILAVTVMAVSWLILAVWANGDWLMPGIVGAVLVAVAAYIITRPSRVPPMS